MFKRYPRKGKKVTFFNKSIEIARKQSRLKIFRLKLNSLNCLTCNSDEGGREKGQKLVVVRGAPLVEAFFDIS